MEGREGCHTGKKDGSYAYSPFTHFEARLRALLIPALPNSYKSPLTGRPVPLRGNLECCLEEYKQDFWVAFSPFLTRPLTLETLNWLETTSKDKKRA